MKINLDDKAAKYIKKEGFDDVYVYVKGCSSWGTGEPQPLVLMGKPGEDIDDYDVHPTNGINVYVRVDVQAGDDGIKIKHSKFLFKDSLIVEGIAY